MEDDIRPPSQLKQQAGWRLAANLEGVPRVVNAGCISHRYDGYFVAQADKLASEQTGSRFQAADGWLE
jgi:hypothetical protein